MKNSQTDNQDPEISVVIPVQNEQVVVASEIKLTLERNENQNELIGKYIKKINLLEIKDLHKKLIQKEYAILYFTESLDNEKKEISESWKTFNDAKLNLSNIKLARAQLVTSNRSDGKNLLGELKRQEKQLKSLKDNKKEAIDNLKGSLNPDDPNSSISDAKDRWENAMKESSHNARIVNIGNKLDKIFEKLGEVKDDEINKSSEALMNESSKIFNLLWKKSKGIAYTMSQSEDSYRQLIINDNKGNKIESKSAGQNQITAISY